MGEEVEKKLEYYARKSIDDISVNIYSFTKEERGFIYKYDKRLYNTLYARYRDSKRTPEERHDRYMKYKEKTLQNKSNIETPYAKLRRLKNMNIINMN